MSIFSLEAKYEKELKKEQQVFQQELAQLQKKAQLERKTLAEFFQTQGAKLFIQYLESQKELCLKALRSRPSAELSMRYQERFDLLCTHLEMIESYLL